MRVVVQKWEERRPGGVFPDGYSIHASEADRTRYCDDYWATMTDGAQWYQREDGHPYWADVPDNLAASLMNGKLGVRIWSPTYPLEVLIP